MSEPITQKVFLECETTGFDEATEKLEALVEAYDGLPAQVTIKNCRNCEINVYPSQTKIIDCREEEKENNDD